MKKLLLIIMALISLMGGLNAQSSEEITIDYDGYSLKFKKNTNGLSVSCATKPTSPTVITVPDSVTMPDGLKYQVEVVYSFEDCSYMTGIELPNTIRLISGSFENCTSLTSIEIPRSVQYFNGPVFKGSGIESIYIPNNVLDIGFWTFRDCANLRSITFEEGSQIQIIDSYVFENCSSLERIEIPETVTEIEDYAFYGCSSLSRVIFGENSQLTTIGQSAFYVCEKLNSINFPQGVTSIGKSAFYGTKIESVYIPNTVTEIGKSAFSNNYAITSVTFEENSQLAIIDDNTFYACTQLTSIEIPNTVTEIRGSAFNSCSNMTTVTFEENSQLTAIGQYAFKSCSSLERIEIPNTVTEIGDYAFYICSSLSHVIFGENSQLTAIGQYAFKSCSSLERIEIPETVTVIGASAFRNCSSLSHVIFGENSQLTAIGEYAFSYCLNLESVYIPNTVTEIGEYAFEHCKSLTTVNIPDSIAYISNGLFYSCSLLTNVDIPNTVTVIGDNAFAGCSNLSRVEIPDAVIYIGYSAFAETGLTSINIPSSVEIIVQSAFSYCPKLESITVEEGNQYYDSRNNCNAIIETYNDMVLLLAACKNTIIPEDIYGIYAGAFAGVDMESIVLPASVMAIGGGNYDYYEGTFMFSTIKTIELPSSLLYLDEAAFYGCSNLNTIRCRAESVPELSSIIGSSGEYLFYDCPSDMTIQVPASSLEDYQNAYPWNEYNLVAGFYYNINAKVDSTEYGRVEGAGEYDEGTTATLTAIPNADYIFLNWTENGKVVSTDAEYSFEVETDRNLTANFIYALHVPTNLVATAESHTAISLSWDIVENALSYNIYMNGELLGQQSPSTGLDIVESESVVSYLAENLDYDTEYCFTVTAVRNETETEKSEAACATTFDLPITTPTNLVATAESHTAISLSWNVVENALSYNIYMNGELLGQQSPLTGSDIVESESVVSYLVENLEYDTEYCFTVTAVRNETETEKSEAACATTFDLPITTPTNLVATAESHTAISLSWDAVENALSYNIYQDGELIGQQTTVNGQQSESSISYLVENLEYNTEYCFTVTAVRNETETEKSEADCATTLQLPIGAPQNIFAVVENIYSILIVWDLVENATSYNVYRNDELVANVASSSYTDLISEYDTEYCYTVTALRDEMESERSEEYCVTTPTLTIETPTNLIAEVIESSVISLKWDMVENATAYKVYCDDKMLDFVPENWYDAKGLTYNTEYCFTVTALIDEVESEKSEAACATTFDLPITTPTNLVATPESTSAISLSWDAVENALSYNIYMNGELLGQQSTVNGQQSESESESESESSISYLVENLEYNTEYCFTVTAVRNETETEKSEVACATTLGDGLEELTSSFEIYPNPVLDKLHIDADTDADIEIYNIKGQQVYKSTRLQACEQQSIDVSDLDSGVYLVRIRTAKGDIMKRIIKK